MRERIQINYKDKPVLLDKVVQDIQKALADNLSWLDCAFGKAHKHIEYTESGKKLVYPVAYTGKGEYMSLLPNDNIGNFSWLDLYDPQEIAFSIPSRPRITLDGALVFWYDLSSIYEDDTFLHTEEIKDEMVIIDRRNGVYECLQKDYSKATAMEYMRKYLGAEIDDIYVFGDSSNDLVMFEYAKHNVAMGKHDPVLEPYAELITDDVDEDGIFHALEKLGII